MMMREERYQKTDYGNEKLKIFYALMEVTFKIMYLKLVVTETINERSIQ